MLYYSRSVGTLQGWDGDTERRGAALVVFGVGLQDGLPIHVVEVLTSLPLEREGDGQLEVVLGRRGWLLLLKPVLLGQRCQALVQGLRFSGSSIYLDKGRVHDRRQRLGAFRGQLHVVKLPVCQPVQALADFVYHPADDKTVGPFCPPGQNQHLVDLRHDRGALLRAGPPLQVLLSPNDLLQHPRLHLLPHTGHPLLKESGSLVMAARACNRFALNPSTWICDKHRGYTPQSQGKAQTIPCRRDECTVCRQNRGLGLWNSVDSFHRDLS